MLVIYTAIYTPFAAAFVFDQHVEPSCSWFECIDQPLNIIEMMVDILFLIDIFINYMYVLFKQRMWDRNMAGEIQLFLGQRMLAKTTKLYQIRNGLPFITSKGGS